MDRCRALPAHPRHRRYAGALAVARCRPRSPAGVERSRFLPLTPLGARALPAELQMLCRSRNRRGRFGEAAIPGCGFASGRDGIKERKLQHLLVPSAVTLPLWPGARPPAPGCETFRGLAESRDEGGMPVAMPIPDGDRHHASAQWLRCLPGTPRGAGRGGRRATWRIPPAPFFPGWKPSPSNA